MFFKKELEKMPIKQPSKGFMSRSSETLIKSFTSCLHGGHSQRQYQKLSVNVMLELTHRFRVWIKVLIPTGSGVIASLQTI